MDVWQILMTPLSWLLKQFCLVFNSYGVALILFSLLVKLIFSPFQLKGKKSMIQMNLLSAQQREIQTKYANNPAKQNEEMQKLYAENGVNPMGGCLWSLIPVFLLFPVYAIVRRPMKYMMWLSEEATAAVAAALGWADFTPLGTNELVLASWLSQENLASASAAAGSDSLFLMNFNFLGLDLSQTPTWKFWEGGLSWNSVGLFLLVVVSAALAVVSMVVLNKTNQMNQDQQQAAAAQNKMMYIMQPMLSLWIGFSWPAGMCVYWIANSVATMVQEIIMGRMLKKDYEQARRVMAEQAAAAKQAEKERRRAAAEKKAAALAEKKSGKKRSGQGKPKENTGPVIDRSASRVGMRQYARGRAYDPNRYPITPYHDPGKKPAEPEQPEELTEEEKAILRQDKRGAALLEQAEAPAAENTEESAEEGAVLPQDGGGAALPEQPEAPAAESAEEPEGAVEDLETVRYNRPDYDHETKE